jgi:hypothetical protein
MSGTLQASIVKDSASATSNLTLDASGNVAVGANLTLSGTAARITGDFTTATIANRVMFQNSITNSNSNVSVIPNGTSTISAFRGYGASDPTNAPSVSLAQIGTTESRLNSEINGTASYTPMTFFTGGSERMRIDTSGNVLVTSPAGLGYGTGSGGTVTQASSKTTVVTLNKPTGQITMNNAALLGATSVVFQFNNTLIGIYDSIICNASQNANYTVQALYAGSGGCAIRVTNITAGSLSEALVINFAIIKGAIS